MTENKNGRPESEASTSGAAQTLVNNIIITEEDEYINLDQPREEGENGEATKPLTKMEHALAHAEAELYVFPVHSLIDGRCSCGDKNCESPGKHPINKGWQNEATRDPEKIKKYWTEDPNANIGIACGERFDTFVLDVDGEEGMASLFALEQEYGDLPTTWTSRTGGGGKHHICRWPKGRNPKNRTRFRPKLDCKSNGGYVVGPGSTHGSGGVYAWEEGNPPEDIERVEPPSWLIDVIESCGAKGEGGGFSKEAKYDHPEEPFGSPYHWLEWAMKKAEPGTRNETGFILAQQLCDNCYQFDPDEKKYVEIMEQYARSVPQGLHRYTEPEAVASFYSAFNFRKMNGFREPTRRQQPLPRTQIGNAERFVRDHGENLCYVPENKSWFEWTDIGWNEDRTFKTEKLGKQTIRNIHKEADLLKGDDKAEARKDLFKWQMASETQAQIDAMISIAKPELAVPIKRLDANPNLLGCQNGTLDLNKAELVHPRREDYITKRIPVSFDPDAECPIWLKFLEEVLPDEEVRDFLQTFAGYSLTGETIEQCLVFCHGEGMNGKTVTIETLASLMGEDYSGKIKSEALMSTQVHAIPNDIAALKGKRFVSASEISNGQKLKEGLIKDLTGGDTIPARFLNKEWFEYKPHFKLWLYGNHKPGIQGKDHGIWRRIKLVPFTVRIAPEKANRRLRYELLEELPGILNWALEGLKKWRKDGLVEPKAVREATNEYRAEQDDLDKFLKDCCDFGPKRWVTKKDMWTAYSLWVKENGEESYKKQTDLNRELCKDSRIEDARTAEYRIWKGIGLNDLWKKRIESLPHSGFHTS